MNETAQTILALALVAVSLGFLLWCGFRRRGGGCEESGCGCGKSVLKPKRK